MHRCFDTSSHTINVESNHFWQTWNSLIGTKTKKIISFQLSQSVNIYFETLKQDGSFSKFVWTSQICINNKPTIDRSIKHKPQDENKVEPYFLLHHDQMKWESERYKVGMTWGDLYLMVTPTSLVTSTIILRWGKTSSPTPQGIPCAE